MTEWDEWARSRPPGLTDQEDYTVTLLHTLARIQNGFDAEWALTGGTALQSFLKPELRRYSSDIEIVTTATRNEVAAWMRDEGWQPEPVGKADIIKSRLTPDGTLFVLHDYGATNLASAEPAPRTFQHYPVPRHPPPAGLKIPLLAYDFLVATKVYAVQEARRGGERYKDVHDLALAGPAADLDRVRAMLDRYVAIRGSPTPRVEVIRAAGAWVQHFSEKRSTEFGKWRTRFVREAEALDTASDLRAAMTFIESLHGGPVQSTPHERRRFLMVDLSAKQLAPIATKLGYTGSSTKELEKMSDFVAGHLHRLEGEAPSDAAALLEELKHLEPQA